MGAQSELHRETIFPKEEREKEKEIKKFSGYGGLGSLRTGWAVVETGRPAWAIELGNPPNKETCLGCKAWLWGLLQHTEH